MPCGAFDPAEAMVVVPTADSAPVAASSANVEIDPVSLFATYA